MIFLKHVYLSHLREETTIFLSVAFVPKDLGRDTEGKEKRKEEGEGGEEKEKEQRK